MRQRRAAFAGIVPSVVLAQLGALSPSVAEECRDDYGERIRALVAAC
jgi:hypothetical protein